MRIGFDAKRAFTNNTGLGNYSRDTIRIISKFFLENNYLLYTPINIKNNRLNFLKTRNNISIHTPKSTLNKIFSSYWRNKNIVTDLIKENITIYHGLTHEIPLGIEKTNIKTIVTIHDLIFMRYPNLFSIIDRKIYYHKAKSACERADKIIAVSEQTKKDIIDFLSINPKKITVVYQGCNNIFQSDEYQKNNVVSKYNIPKNYLLYVGSVEKRKNLLTLLKAIKELPDKNLVVIGNGKKYKNQCVEFIERNNLSNRTLFLSNLKLEEIAEIYKKASIMIYPSTFEGFGIPIIEALFSKIPVITSKNGCFSEAGGEKTRYVNPLSIQEIKIAINEIENSKKIQDEMKTEGYKYVQKFTDKKIAQNLMQVYTDLL